MSVPSKRYRVQFSRFDYFIIVFTYVFFPLALIIAGLRILPTQRHHPYQGRNMRLVGWSLFGSYIICFIIFLLAMETSEEFLNDNLTLAICLLLPAIGSLVAADLVDKKFQKLMEVYKEAVLQQRLVYIEHIAFAAHQSPAHVTRDLNFMIKERMLPYGKIVNGELIMRSLHREPVTPVETQENIEVQSVECSGCGARTVISRDEEKECEYCGTVIVA
ncbi:hypothetical protein [Paenibacillus solani]|uniref:hypothetical protein n=1 Tax=Paenibacillus solani TaxID=1705565 RepID=UPI003D287486